MNESLVSAPPKPTPVTARQRMSHSLLWTMSTAGGIAVANLYYNQPLLADMARTFHAQPHEIGLVATFTQIGYAAGMPLFVPLGDLMDRRKLISFLFVAVGVALASAALAQTLLQLVVASFLIGLTTVIAQILIPLSTELAPVSEQGRTIGSILTGVFLGILLARTVSGVVAAHFGWRTMYWLAAGAAVVCSVVLYSRLPSVPSHANIRYRDLIRSMVDLVTGIPKLRQVSLVAAMLFAAFSAFWTTLIFLLQTPPYHYGSEAAGLFGLVGASGAAAAPIAGRLADRRTPRFVIAITLVIIFVAFVIFWLFAFNLWLLVAGIILLDIGVQSAQVANQTRVLSLRPDARNRVNTVYMICYFGGAALGSFAGTWAWTRWHWAGVCGAGICFVAVATIAFLMRGPEPAANRFSS